MKSTLLTVLILVGFAERIEGLDAICERIDFNDFTRSRITECSGTRKEIFRLASYANSQLFRPYRENVQYYLSNDVNGISCSETIESFYMHEYTEIRLIYQLVYRSPSTLTLRILDMDRLEGGLPRVAQRWSSQNQTNTWSLFAGRVQQEIKRAKLQIEVDITVGANIAIEYITVFNSLVQEKFCKDLDEFYTSTEAPTTTTTMRPASTTTTTTPRPTTTLRPTTTPRPTTTTTLRTTTSTLRTTTSTTPGPTTSTTQTTTTPTTTLQPSTTTTASTTRPTRTRTTTPSTTTVIPEPPTTTSSTSTSTSTLSSTFDSDLQTDPTPLPATQPESSGAVWIALTGVFITLFIMACAMALYIYCNTRQLSQALAEQFGVVSPPPKNTNHHANNNALPVRPPHDHTIHRKLQQQLKNRLRQQHSLEDFEEFERRVSVERQSRQASSVNVNLNRPADHGGRKGQDFRDDISEMKFKSRMSKY